MMDPPFFCRELIVLRALAWLVQAQSIRDDYFVKRHCEEAKISSPCKRPDDVHSLFNPVIPCPVRAALMPPDSSLWRGAGGSAGDKSGGIESGPYRGEAVTPFCKQV